MNDAQELILLIIILYLSECCVLVRKSAVIFRSTFTRDCLPAKPPAALSNEHGGVLPLNPLPPFGSLFLCQSWPIAVSRDGIRTRTLPEEQRTSGREAFIAFDEVQGIWRDQRKVLINGQVFLRLDSDASAARFADLLTSLWKAHPADRDALLDSALVGLTDTESAQRQLTLYQRLSGPLRVLSIIMFVIIFGLVPGTLLYGPLRPHWLRIVVVALFGLFGTVSTFYYAHLQLLPELHRPRFKAIATMILTPTAAIRACDALSRHALENFHPLTAAAVVCPLDIFQRYARKAMLILRHPSDLGLPTDQAAVEYDFDQRLQLAFTAILIQRGWDPMALTAPPIPSDPSCRSYCPRCDSQFVIDHGRCGECGIPIVPFPAAAAQQQLSLPV